MFASGVQGQRFGRPWFLRAILVVTALGLAAPWAAGAQEPVVPSAREGRDAAFLDATARQLLERARESWWQMDRQIQSYEAIVRERMAAALRTPLKDRTLYRAETASRVYWSAADETVVQVLGARQEHPGGVDPPEEIPGFAEEVFDPAADRIYFGLPGDDDDDIWVEHPVAPGSEVHYRYRTGDTLTLSLPDGRRLRAVEVEVLPREASFRLLSGSLWIEPESGALVRAVYRLARTVDVIRDLDESDPDVENLPGIFLPLEFEMAMAVVEYALWDFEYWLPRRMRVEGTLRAGILKVPASMESSYRILDVRGPEEVAEAGDGPEPAGEVAERWLAEGRYGAYERDGAFRLNDGDRIYTLLPTDPARLHHSEHLPPPIWDEAPGFAGEAELKELYDQLAGTPAPEVAGPAPELTWGLQRPGLVRYNRVEGLSVGARGTLTAGSPAGPLNLSATARISVPEAVPDVSGRVVRGSLRRSVELEGYHRVAEVDPRARTLGPGNSAAALFFGRDDGDYYRATGGAVTLRPPATRRDSWRLRLSAERHRPLEAATDFSLSRWLGGAEDPFRPNVRADPGTEYAAALTVSPWWGSEARSAQAGLELLVQGATGTRDFARTRLVGRAALPLFSGLRIGVEAAAGAAWGDVPVQRRWFLGGARTLRGYAGATAVGEAMYRSRLELARQVAFSSVALFSDAGWAGDRDDADLDDALLSAGVGASFLDGLIRIDAARALRAPEGWRLEMYLDAVL